MIRIITTSITSTTTAIVSSIVAVAIKRTEPRTARIDLTATVIVGFCTDVILPAMFAAHLLFLSYPILFDIMVYGVEWRSVTGG